MYVFAVPETQTTVARSRVLVLALYMHHSTTVTFDAASSVSTLCVLRACTSWSGQPSCVLTKLTWLLSHLCAVYRQQHTCWWYPPAHTHTHTQQLLPACMHFTPLWPPCWQRRLASARPSQACRQAARPGVRGVFCVGVVLHCGPLPACICWVFVSAGCAPHLVTMCAQLPSQIPAWTTTSDVKHTQTLQPNSSTKLKPRFEADNCQPDSISVCVPLCASAPA